MREIKNVPGLNPEDVVVIKKYTYGEQAKLSQKIARLSIDDIKAGKSGASEPDIYAAMIYPLVYGVVSAPFFNVGASEAQKVVAIENLEGDTGKFLMEEVKNYNGLDDGTTTQKK